MAIRPAWTLKNGKVVCENFEFQWNGGFAVVQKQKNITALHESVKSKYGTGVLEISTKGMNEQGKKLSAFNLKVEGIPLENVFQASKKYEKGGPYTDLLKVKPADAKRDERHKNSGALTAFEREGIIWPTEPKTLFYDFLYVSAVYAVYGDSYSMDEYEWFTDIEFNPNKSVNCQARGAAIYKLIMQMKAFDVLEDMDKWRSFHEEYVKG